MGTSGKRFRVAFSFAGEKREFVSQIADILAKRFGETAILYDRYHQAEFSRARLALYLGDLYEKSSDLIVAVLCPAYEGKEWCGLEWDAILGLIKAGKGDQVMLTRFGLVEGEGLRGLAGYTDLDDLTPEQAADGILERLALNEGHPDNYYKSISTSGGRLHTSTPNNLPRIQSFFGRERELAAIREALDPESRTWGALIDGPGGMGKTSLAVRAAYDCPHGQFQRIIFLSLKNRELDDDGERELGSFILPGLLEMLNELARELGHSDIAKAPEDQRIRLLLNVLRTSEVLLVLDNLESLTKSDRDQLLTFVKRLPLGCKAILTSRERIGSSADLLILEQLDQAAALETLADLARHNPLLARTTDLDRITLHDQTGGNPLLLRWVAGQLGRGSCRTLTDALNFLRSCPPDNDPLEFIFGDLTQEFTPEETAVLAALSYFTLPAKIAHIALLADLGDPSVEIVLRALANRSLVVSDQEEKLLALVPMVAEFLRRKLPDVLALTAARLEQRAYEIITENGNQQYDRFPVLDALWPTVAAALPIFLAGQNPRLQVVCGSLHQFFEFTGRWDEWLALELQAEANAVAAKDHKAAGWRAFQAGYIHYLRQEADAVLACVERAALLWHIGQAGVRERSAVIRLRGIGHQLKKDYPSAMSAYREALELRRTSGPDDMEVALVLNDLADVEQRSGDRAAAEQHYREALRVAVAVGDAAGVATFTGNLAGLALSRGDWAEGESLAREAMASSTRIGRQELIAADSVRLALALLRQGKSAEAAPRAARGVEVYTRLGSPNVDVAREILRECSP